jgi:hypothetical protein
MAEQPGIHERCAIALRDRAEAAMEAAVTALVLSNAPVMHLQAMQELKNVVKPCGTFWFADAEETNGGTNLREMIGYVVHFAAVDLKLKDQNNPPRRLLLIRELVSDAMRERRWAAILATVPEIEEVESRLLTVIEEDVGEFQVWQSKIDFVVWCKKLRGLRS